MRIMKLIILVAVLTAASPVVAQQTGTGKLKTKVDPGRAGVFVDGKYMGPAANFRFSRTYTLAAGEHEVTLSEPRYEDVTTKVTITAGQTAVLRQTLKRLPPPSPPFGRLRVQSSDKFAAVFLNGKYVGHADEFNACAQGLLIPPGEYALKIVSQSGDPLTEQKVSIQRDAVALVQTR